MARKKVQDGTQASSGSWYEQALFICFGNLADAAFLRIFAAPMCIPVSKNFGKKAGEGRTSGRTGGDSRSRADIAGAQLAVLEKYGANLRGYRPGAEETAAERAESLPGVISHEAITGMDWAYSAKRDNYTAGRFLSMFLHAGEVEGLTAGSLMDRVVDYYTRVMELLFEGRSDELRMRCQILGEELGKLQPGLEIPEACLDTRARKMGWTLCAYLLLAAHEESGSEESAGMLAQVLKVTRPVPSRSGRMGDRGSVALNWAQFQGLCAAAFRAELELEELRTVYQILKGLRAAAGGETAGELRGLVTEFRSKLKQLVLDRSAKISADPGSARQLLTEASEAQDLYEECGLWLE